MTAERAARNVPGSPLWLHASDVLLHFLPNFFGGLPQTFIGDFLHGDRGKFAAYGVEKLAGIFGNFRGVNILGANLMNLTGADADYVSAPILVTISILPVP